MYSLVFILPTGIILKDNKIAYYASVLSGAGLIVSIYHNLIYYDVIREGIKVCTVDLSCKSKQLAVWGFVTIPMMSFFAFLLILLISLRSIKNEVK
jgi:disulfide bond formation protein DsbB